MTDTLKDTPQQALAGWLHQRGGEKAIEKMAEDLGLSHRNFCILFDGSARAAFPPDVNLTPCASLSVVIALYTDGEVIFPNCPAWAVEKAGGCDRRQLAGLSFTARLMAKELGQYQAFERSWFFKLWRFFHG